MSVLTTIDLQVDAYVLMLERLDNLLIPDPDDPDDMPSPESVQTAKDWLTHLHDLAIDVPRGSTANYGSKVYVYFRHGERFLQLIANGTGQPIGIFHSEGREYGLEKTSAVADLIKWLDWYKEGLT